jgi:transposase InsO family protein
VAYLVRQHGVSQRRACRVVGQHRSTQRYDAVPAEFEQRLVKEMRRLAEVYPRWGYRTIHALLVEDGWQVNRKRVERLWRLHEMQVPSGPGPNGKKAGGTEENSAWALPALRPGHIWSYDFVASHTIEGGPLRILNVVDEFTRECVGSHVARSIGAREVTVFLEQLFESHGPPAIIRSDNGREFIADTVVDFLAEHGVTAAFIAKASPQQNCYVERFNGTMRRELLNGELFHSMLEARVLIHGFVQTYNHARPHRALKMQPPALRPTVACSQPVAAV